MSGKRSHLHVMPLWAQASALFLSVNIKAAPLFTATSFLMYGNVVI